MELLFNKLLPLIKQAVMRTAVLGIPFFYSTGTTNCLLLPYFTDKVCANVEAIAKVSFRVFFK